MKDNNKLQTLQNNVNRILLKANSMTFTVDLCHLTDSLSVHQMIAFQTLVMTHKIVQSGEPSYIADKIKSKQTNARLRGGRGTLTVPPYKLSVSREGFIYRGAYLHNMLGVELRDEQNISCFKREAKEWVKWNISLKPKSHFDKIIERKHEIVGDNSQTLTQAENNQAPSQPSENKITKYFMPIKK